MAKYRSPEPEATDPDEYIEKNPKYAQCRKRHAWEEVDENWTETYDDPKATHMIRERCVRCGILAVSRARRIGFEDYAFLDRRYAEKPPEYAAKGVRITGRVVDKHRLVALERQEREKREREKVKARKDQQRKRATASHGTIARKPVRRAPVRRTTQTRKSR